MGLTESQVSAVKQIAVPDESLSDETIIADVLSGNVNAYGLIMRRYNQRIYRVARSIVQNDSTAMDVVQEAHIKAYSKLSAFTGASSFLTWLYSITRNEALMHLRKYKMERSMNIVDLHSFDHDKEESLTDMSVACDENIPEKLLENDDLKDFINRNIDTLSEDYRIIFVLFAVDKLSVKEVAEILGITESTAKTRFFRAKRLMREKVNAYLASAEMKIYEFGGEHCDVVVHNVLVEINHQFINKK